MLGGFLLAAASVVVAGGDLRRLSDVRFRYAAVLFIALLAQVVIISVLPRGNEGLKEGIHVATYVMIFAFLAVNIRVPGVWLIAVGALLNFAAIVANGGVMPAAPDAVERAGLGEGNFENSQVVEDPRLLVLGDRFAIPERWPFSNVFSVGDVLIVLGAALGMHQIGRSRIVPKKNLRDSA